MFYEINKHRIEIFLFFDIIFIQFHQIVLINMS